MMQFDKKKNYFIREYVSCEHRQNKVLKLDFDTGPLYKTEPQDWVIANVRPTIVVYFIGAHFWQVYDYLRLIHTVDTGK